MARPTTWGSVSRNSHSLAGQPQLERSQHRGKQPCPDQADGVARIDRLHWLLPGKLVDLSGHAAADLCRPVTAVDHLYGSEVHKLIAVGGDLLLNVFHPEFSFTWRSNRFRWCAPRGQQREPRLKSKKQCSKVHLAF